MRSTLLFLFAALLCGAVSDAAAQDARWQAFPSLSNVQAVDASGDALWAGTRGGVFRYAPASGEIERFTPVQGLGRVDTVQGLGAAPYQLAVQDLHVRGRDLFPVGQDDTQP